MNGLSLYFHIPYCKSKCYYCDFISYVNAKDTEEAYFNAVLKEIEMYKDLHGLDVKSIFFGGGTPSIVDSKHIELIVNKCRNMFKLDGNAEISIECNPDSLTLDKLKDYKRIGINRLSIGLQTMDDEQLKVIGRIHTKGQFLEAFNNAKLLGFNNINVDLIFGLPGQTLDSWINNLKEVVKLSQQHISCYSLTLGHDTKLCKLYEDGKIEIPDDDLNREMYHKAQKLLKANGYKHYEISNFAKEKFECRHNLSYWTYDEYIGFGVAAHSFINRIRYANTNQIEDYIKSINSGEFNYIEKNIISKEEQISEYIITGMRLIEGINKKKFCRYFGIDIYNIYNKAIEKYISLGLLIDDGENIYFTEKGLDLSNSVLCEFV